MDLLVRQLWETKGDFVWETETLANSAAFRRWWREGTAAGMERTLELDFFSDLIILRQYWILKKCRHYCGFFLFYFAFFLLLYKCLSPQKRHFSLGPHACNVDMKWIQTDSPFLLFVMWEAVANFSHYFLSLRLKWHQSLLSPSSLPFTRRYFAVPHIWCHWPNMSQ